ncbi:MAG: hypothetical protein ACO1SV_00715 [Fimbriimonas sp.]
MANSTGWNQNRGKRPMSGAAITGIAKDKNDALQDFARQLFPGIPKSGDGDLPGMFKRYGKYLYEPAASRMAYNASLEGDYQSTLTAILSRLQNTNYARQADRAGNRFQQSYAKFSAQADQQARAMGLGEGTRAAAARGLSNQAARGEAAARQTWLDPSRRTNDMMQSLQLLSQAMESNPYLAQQIQLNTPIEARRQATQRTSGGGGGLFGGLLRAGLQYGLSTLGGGAGAAAGPLLMPDATPGREPEYY